MQTETAGGPLRLRGAGIGSIFGGLTLGMLSVGLPYVSAAGVALAAGIALWLSNRRSDIDLTGIGVGCAAVGAIGLVEAFGLGLGFGPVALSVIAIAAGAIDVLVGGTLDRFRKTS